MNERDSDLINSLPNGVLDSLPNGVRGHYEAFVVQREKGMVTAVTVSASYCDNFCWELKACLVNRLIEVKGKKMKRCDGAYVYDIPNEKKIEVRCKSGERNVREVHDVLVANGIMKS